MRICRTELSSLIAGTGKKPWILIAAYDVSTGVSSEGHVAFNLLRYLSEYYRIILLTRRNNKVRLKTDPTFIVGCPGVHVLGYDLPKWASWWKRGARFYQAYAYLWQMTWPLVLQGRRQLKKALRLIHLLNFHNDNIPSLAWRLGLPVVWGPINHNEIVASWRRTFWPSSLAIRHIITFALRRGLWMLDPFLRLQIQKSDVILSAGGWVERRLDLRGAKKVISRSQLGVSQNIFNISADNFRSISSKERELICAGRLDWIKGIDLAIEALLLLPVDVHLRIIGKGPAEQRLRNLVVQLGVETRVIFQPSVPRNVLSSLYAKADLFLFTSAEVAGLVWIEALASGIPVVAFDGTTEVAAASRHLPGIHLAMGGKGRSGWVESLATTIKVAIDKPCDPVVLRTAVLKHYGWDALAATISNAYSGVIEAVR